MQVAEFAVNGSLVAPGFLPVQAVGGLVLHAALAVVFALGLRRTM